MIVIVDVVGVLVENQVLADGDLGAFRVALDARWQIRASPLRVVSWCATEQNVFLQERHAIFDDVLLKPQLRQAPLDFRVQIRRSCVKRRQMELLNRGIVLGVGRDLVRLEDRLWMIDQALPPECDEVDGGRQERLERLRSQQKHVQESYELFGDSEADRFDFHLLLVLDEHLPMSVPLADNAVEHCQEAIPWSWVVLNPLRCQERIDLHVLGVLDEVLAGFDAFEHRRRFVYELVERLRLLAVHKDE